MLIQSGLYEDPVLCHDSFPPKAGSLKMNTALEYSTRVVQEGAIDVKRVLLTLCVCLYLYFNLLGNLAPCGAITEIAHRRMEEWQKKIHCRCV